MRFEDRQDAGRQLAQMLAHLRDQPCVVLALPRGGVPVGYEVAKALDAPLDVFLVRKLGVPGHEELAMGAIASGDVRVINDEVVQMSGVTPDDIEATTRREIEELKRREQKYRGDRPLPELSGRTAILVDDGLATGATMLAAVEAVRQLNPARIVVAIPTASPGVVDKFRREVDEVVCAITPPDFRAVGMYYVNFEQTTDQEVHDLLRKAD